MTTLRAQQPSPLAKVYDGFSTAQLLDTLRQFEHNRLDPAADEDFYVPRIDTITGILRSRGIDPSAPTIFDEVSS